MKNQKIKFQFIVYYPIFNKNQKIDQNSKDRSKIKRQIKNQKIDQKLKYQKSDEQILKDQKSKIKQ